jgi:putative transposase
MSYRQVLFRTGGYYHIYNRGNNFQSIFFEHENYLYFLRQMRKYLVTDAVEIIAYCLMPNHYHLLVYLKTDDLSNLMQPLVLSYTKAINKRYGRVGTLFQGRFKGIHVEHETYLLHLSRYIHLNPITAGLVKQVEKWEFSSYLEFIGLRNGTLPKPEVILSQFSTPAAYRQFVESYRENDKTIIAHLMLD